VRGQALLQAIAPEIEIGKRISQLLTRWVRFGAASALVVFLGLTALVWVMEGKFVLLNDAAVLAAVSVLVLLVFHAFDRLKTKFK